MPWHVIALSLLSLVVWSTALGALPAGAQALGNSADWSSGHTAGEDLEGYYRKDLAIYEQAGPEAAPLARAATMSATDLASSYARVAYNLALVGLARKRANVVVVQHGKQVTVDASNVDTYEARYRKNLAVYTSAIKRRGYREVSGSYSATATEACKAAWPMLFGVVAAGEGPKIKITQKSSKIELGLTIHRDGRTAGIAHTGIIIDTVLIIRDANAFVSLPEFTIVGEVSASDIKLRPFIKRIQETYRNYRSDRHPNWEALSECYITLTPDR